MWACISQVSLGFGEENWSCKLVRRILEFLREFTEGAGTMAAWGTLGLEVNNLLWECCCWCEGVSVSNLCGSQFQIPRGKIWLVHLEWMKYRHGCQRPTLLSAVSREGQMLWTWRPLSVDRKVDKQQQLQPSVTCAMLGGAWSCVGVCQSRFFWRQRFRNPA